MRGEYSRATGSMMRLTLWIALWETPVFADEQVRSPRLTAYGQKIKSVRKSGNYPIPA
jgi:hypothetical protein